MIDQFYINGSHSPLSNFWVGEPLYMKPYGWQDQDDVFEWITVEHYYQASKAVGWSQMVEVKDCQTPGLCKRAGRKVTLRDDWEAVKFDVMRKALAVKFAHWRDEALFLLDTGDQILIEGNNWRDEIWGCSPDKHGNYTIGQNWLGILLMAQRAILRGN